MARYHGFNGPVKNATERDIYNAMVKGDQNKALLITEKDMQVNLLLRTLKEKPSKEALLEVEYLGPWRKAIPEYNGDVPTSMLWMIRRKDVAQWM